MIREWIRRRAADPRASRWAVALGCLLALPSVAGGLQVDDVWHKIVLRGEPFPDMRRPVWDVFRFVDGHREHTLSLIDRGALSWWTDPDVKLAFVRPLSSILHAFDHAVFPSAPWAMHLHSLLWFALLLSVASALFRRLLSDTTPDGPTAAGLAAIFYSISCARGTTVGWIAQRNSLIAGTFALTALYFHDRAAREPGRRADPWLAVLAFAVSLLGGEGALAVLGILAAHAWMIDPRPRPLRFLAPYGAVILAWALLYRTLDGGARHSAVYVDPLADPMRFASGVFVRLPLLLAGELGGILPDPFPLLPLGPQIALFALALVALGFTLASLQDRVDRFLLLGAALGSLPLCSTIPSGRLMTIVGVPLVALQARLVTRWVLGEPRTQGALRAWGTWVLYGRLFLGPLLFLVTASQFQVIDRRLQSLAESIPDELGRRPALYVVNGPGFMTVYASIHRALVGRPMSRQFAWLANGTRPLSIHRTDARTLEVHVDGGLYRDPLDQLTNDPSRRFSVGQTVVLPDAVITIRSVTPSGIPDTYTFTFADAADAETRGFVTWTGNVYTRWTVPPIGTNTTFAAVSIF